jgi:ribosomal-protein-serine acetyltransferase
MNMPSELNPIPVDAPMPIRTPRLIIRPMQVGDGAITAAAVAETWHDLNQWMAWAESLDDNTAEKQELRTRSVIDSFVRREEFNLVGIETASSEPVVWCGFHQIDGRSRQCETGFWVRKKAQNRGFATEATNALLQYAFSALGMRKVGITHSAGNEASRRVIEKLGFGFVEIQPLANPLPNGRIADRLCYARVDLLGLPALDVRWGES